MPEIKYVSIDDTKDLRKLFELICSDILNKPTIDVKKELLGFTGKDKDILSKQITFNDIFVIADKIDLPFKLTLRYSVPSVNNPVVKEPVPTNPVVKELEQQAQQLKSPVPAVEEMVQHPVPPPPKGIDSADDIFAE